MFPFLIFYVHIYNTERKPSTQRGSIFSSFTSQLFGKNTQTPNLKFSNRQIVANRPYNATEIVRFLKYIYSFFENKLNFLQNQ